jgi:hypothetical protein
VHRAALAIVLVLLSPAAAEAGDAKALVDRARAARSAGRLDEALELMRQAYEIDPAPALLNNVAVLLEALGRYREAHDTFQRVIALPRVSAELKAKDAERVRVLERRLSQAWLRVAAPAGFEARVDGTPWTHAGESDVLPGEHVVEVRDADGRSILIERTYSVTGRRSDLPTPPSLEHALATMVVRCPAAVAGLEIDRYTVSRPIAKDARVRIVRGSYDVRLECEGGPTYAGRVDATHRETVIPTAEMVEPTAVVMPPPPPPEAPSKWPSLVVGGIGLAGVGVGAGLLVSAGADGAAIDDGVPMNGGRADLTFREAGALDDRRRTKTDVGAVVLTTGVVALVAGAVWYFL